MSYYVVGIPKNPKDPSRGYSGYAIFDDTLDGNGEYASFDYFVGLLLAYDARDFDMNGDVTFGERYASSLFGDTTDKFVRKAYTYLYSEHPDPRFYSSANWSLVTQSSNLLLSGIDLAYGIKPSILETLANKIGSKILGDFVNSLTDDFLGRMILKKGADTLVAKLIGGDDTSAGMVVVHNPESLTGFSEAEAAEIDTIFGAEIAPILQAPQESDAFSSDAWQIITSGEPAVAFTVLKIFQDFFRNPDMTLEQARDLHYGRNGLLDEAMTYEKILSGGYRLLSDTKSVAHRINVIGNAGNEKNQKWVSLDGTEEYVFRAENGSMVLLTENNDPLNEGTYNFAAPEFAYAHTFLDVLPWLIWGNTRDDTSLNFDERLAVFIGWGGIEWMKAGALSPKPEWIFDREDVGGSGDNTFIGTPERTDYTGMFGTDTVNYFNSTTSVAALLHELSGIAGDAAGDFYTSIENVFGSQNDDYLFGNTSDNLLKGRAGNDYLVGKAGSDTLEGQFGDDRLRGDEGDDTLDGADGEDTAIYGGVLADYSVTRDASGDVIVTHVNGGSDGTDRLLSVEVLEFSDRVVLVEEFFAPVLAQDVADQDAGQTQVGELAVDAVAESGNRRLILDYQGAVRGYGIDHVELNVSETGSDRVHPISRSRV